MSPHLYASVITPLALILNAGALHACIDAIGFVAEYRDLPLGTDDALGDFLPLSQSKRR